MPEGAAGAIVSAANLERVLTLDASGAEFVAENKISGTYTDVVSSADPGKVYLNRTSTGSFVLIRDLSLPADVDTEFQP